MSSLSEPVPSQGSQNQMAAPRGNYFVSPIWVKSSRVHTTCHVYNNSDSAFRPILQLLHDPELNPRPSIYTKKYSIIGHLNLEFSLQKIIIIISTTYDRGNGTRKRSVWQNPYPEKTHQIAQICQTFVFFLTMSLQKKSTMA